MSNSFVSDKRSIGVFPGGGTQGVISAFLAEEFESHSGLLFHENFDQIEGLSVGALNAACLWPLEKTGKPLCTATELKDIYVNRIDDAFEYKKLSLGGLLDSKYDITGLEKLIGEIFGDHKLSDFADGLHIYVLDVSTKELRTLRSEDAKKNPENDFYMRDLLRTAVSAPHFFEPVEIKNMAGTPAIFVDGGLFSSDPSFKAYFDAKNQLKPGTDIMMTVFATGHKNNEHVTKDDLNGGIGKLNNILNVVFKSKVHTFHEMLKQALGANYVRLDVDISNTEIGLIADHISEVIPHAQRATFENQDKISWALDNIHGDKSLPDNIIPFPPYGTSEPDIAVGM